MSISPYLSFQGTCRDAMTFYAEVFGTELTDIMTADEMPGFDDPQNMRGKIAHCSLPVADGVLMACDDLMRRTGPMDGCSVMVALPDARAAAAAFARLSEGGTVRTPFQETFWTAGFGTLTDRFGIHWMLSTEDEP